MPITASMTTVPVTATAVSPTMATVMTRMKDHRSVTAVMAVVARHGARRKPTDVVVRPSAHSARMQMLAPLKVFIDAQSMVASGLQPRATPENTSLLRRGPSFGRGESGADYAAGDLRMWLPRPDDLQQTTPDCEDQEAGGQENACCG